MTLINILKTIEGSMPVLAYTTNEGPDMPVYVGRVQDIRLGTAEGHSVYRVKPFTVDGFDGEIGLAIELSK